MMPQAYPAWPADDYSGLCGLCGLSPPPLGPSGPPNPPGPPGPRAPRPPGPPRPPPCPPRIRWISSANLVSSSRSSLPSPSASNFIACSTNRSGEGGPPGPPPPGPPRPSRSPGPPPARPSRGPPGPRPSRPPPGPSAVVPRSEPPSGCSGGWARETVAKETAITAMVAVFRIPTRAIPGIVLIIGSLEKAVLMISHRFVSSPSTATAARGCGRLVDRCHWLLRPLDPTQ